MIFSASCAYAVAPADADRSTSAGPESALEEVDYGLLVKAAIESQASPSSSLGGDDTPFQDLSLTAPSGDMRDREVAAEVLRPERLSHVSDLIKGLEREERVGTAVEPTKVAIDLPSIDGM